MSIDREINARVDAYGKNPQALQKKYSMTKELVDLLALQKIKKSMDSARAAVEAQMQTNPATIKQQREQEIFGRTAQDVAQQVGGVLQTAKNRQQMAQRRPAPQGLGALMPQQGQRPQQPQTRMMQAGGIVAFEGGGTVETLFGEQGAILPLGLEKESGIRDRVQYAIDTNVPLSRFSTEQLQSLQSDNDQYTPKIKAELARRQSEPKQSTAAVAEKVTDAPKVKPPTQDQTGGIATVVEPKIPTAENALVLRDQGNNYQDKKDTPKPPPPVDRGTTPPAPKPFDLQGKLDEVGAAPTPVMVDRTGLEKPGVDFTKAYGVDPASIDPEARGVAALQKAEDYYGVKEKDTELRKGLAELAALDAAQTDPDKLRRDRLKRFLLGGAGRGSTALAGAGAASANLGAAQQRDIRSRQIKRNEMLKEIQNQDLEVRKLAKGEERAAIERADKIKLEGMRIISTMSNAELSARQTEANAINQSNIANYKGKMERVQLLLEQSNAAIDQAIERAKLASIDAQRRGQIAQSGIDDAMRRKTEIAKILEQTYRDQVNADPTIFSLRNSLAKEGISTDEEQEINAAIKKRLADIKANLAVAQQADLNEMDQLNDKILELENLRNSALGGGISDIALSTEDEDLVRRNQPE